MTTPGTPAEIELVLPVDAAGARLDATIAAAAPQLSRSYVARLLKDGAILLDGQPAKPSHKVRGGERVSIDLPEPEVLEARPEAIPLEIVFEDHDIVVVNKPAGMVVHPSSGHATGSLVNALLYHCVDLSTINGALRPGIVHRLDKDTSGLIIAAKNDAAHRGLAEQFASRTVQKEYLALCHGNPPADRFACSGRIGRHPGRRTEMTVMRGADEGREAHTDFEVLERFPAPVAGATPPHAAPCFDRGAHGTGSQRQGCPWHTPIFLVRAMPKTGRTHQIRVHLAKSGYPVLADELYGKSAAPPELGLHRHALHAHRLVVQHPTRAEKLAFEAPLPDDMKRALEILRGGLKPRMN